MKHSTDLLCENVLFVWHASLFSLNGRLNVHKCRPILVLLWRVALAEPRCDADMYTCPFELDMGSPSPHIYGLELSSFSCGHLSSLMFYDATLTGCFNLWYTCSSMSGLQRQSGVNVCGFTGLLKAGWLPLLEAHCAASPM